MNRLFTALCCFALTACCGAKENENIFPASGDVGAVKHPGSVAFDAASGVYTLTGSGTNMWGTEDEFFMVWREVTGDFSLSADIAFEGAGVNAHRKMGLIIRDGVDGEAVYANVAVHGDGLTSLQYRTAKGAETLEVAAGFASGDAVPDHIVLKRTGNRITAGASCKTMAPSTGGPVGIDLEMPETCLVGLFVCSHDADVLETGYFSGVKFQ